MATLGIDPSFTRTGLVMVDDGKVIGSETVSAPRKLRGGDRLAWMTDGITDAIVACPPVRLAVVEDVAYGYRNNHTLVELSKLLGIIETVLTRLKIDYALGTVNHVRKWLTGRGDTDKEGVARAIKRRWGIEFERDPGHDLSDACALALWGEGFLMKLGGALA